MEKRSSVPNWAPALAPAPVEKRYHCPQTQPDGVMCWSLSGEFMPVFNVSVLNAFIFVRDVRGVSH